MEDLNLKIVEDNVYYLKTPFEGKICEISVKKGDKVEKDQRIAIIELSDDIVALQSDYEGIVKEINVSLDESLDKWETVMTIDIIEEDEESDFEIDALFGNMESFKEESSSPDYQIIYNFQQNSLPNHIFIRTEQFLFAITEKR